MTPSLFRFGRSRRRARERETGLGERQASTSSAEESTQADVQAPEAPSLPQEPGEVVAPARDAVVEPAPPAAPHPSPAIEEALERWRQELVDLGGVASLDDITVLDGVVDLTAAHPSGLAQLYAGRPTHLSSLVRERAALAVARQSLREVAERTDLLARQFGVAPVYLALGVATWSQPIDPAPTGDDDVTDATRDDITPVTQPAQAGDPAATSALTPSDLAAYARASHPDGPAGEVPTPEPDFEGPAAARAPQEPENDERPRHLVNAPMLLRPVRLASTGGDATITLGPSIEVNPVLTRALREAGCRTDVDAIARGALSDVGFTPRAAMTRLASLGRQYLDDFAAHERLVVGAFVHPGQALVEDFDATIERARTSALVAALAGEEDARRALDITLSEPNPEDRDPAAERGGGDLDVAQADAVEAVSSGASLLLDAPPGSDVAATLAAVLADAAASGRTVLHVPATSADGHAVAGVLRDLGLGDMVVDLTEDPAWRMHAAEAVKESLGVQPPELDVEEIVALREELTSLRAQMGQAITALHEPRAPWGVSAYEALQHLADFTTGRGHAYTTARIAPQHLAGLDERGLERAVTLMRRARDLGLLKPEGARSAWSGIKVADIDEATDALERLTQLADTLLPQLRADVEECSARAGTDQARTVSQWRDQLMVLDGVRDCLDVFLPEVFERPADELVAATADRQWRSEHGVDMSGSARRRLTKQARDLVRPGRAVSDLHAELVRAQEHRERWRALNPEGVWPVLPAGLDRMIATAATVHDLLAQLQPLLDTAEQSPELLTLDLDELEALVGALADDDSTAQKLPEVNQVLADLAAMGLIDLVNDLAERGVREGDVRHELMYCWWASLLADLLHSDPALADLDETTLGERAARLRELDAAHCATLAGPLKHAYATAVRRAVDADKETARALYVALSRDDGVPLREILADYPLALVSKPVWIVPPTLVPQVFTPDAVVGLAVLDASAHLPVSQALPAFVRAEQVLVVGDPRRDSSGLATELGSLLPSVVLPTTRNTLAAPIASFLATHGYGEVVEAIPSPPGELHLSLELVDGRGMPAPGQTAVESVPAEVERVVDLVIEHALAHPDQSLGVVALSARHAEQVRRACAEAVAGAPALESFFAAGITEPFVVVDLSEARSLRRDHVIISVGYAKTPHGRTIHSFGSLSQAGGMVGLVEALCASRGSTQVVSCLAPEDIDPERLHSAGSQLLREMLVRAAGGAPEVAQAGEGQPDALLVDLAERLWRQGLTVIPRYGLEGGPRIPLAIGHPDYPDELLVAVLTDDDQYVAEPSLRRRDRYWVERLEQRGWRVYSAFSVSLFVDPQAQAKAIEQMVLDVLTERDAQRQAQAPAGSAVPQVDPVTGEVVEAPSEPVPVEVDSEQGPGSEDEVGQEPSTADGATQGGRQVRLDADGQPVRDARPPIAQGLPLQAYSDDQLDELVTWIRSDGVERSVEEEIEELRATLALRRRGSGVDAVLTHAVTRSRGEDD